MNKQMPNVLRLLDGKLYMSDDTDVKEYLKGWLDRDNVSPYTPVTIMTSKYAQKLLNDSTKWEAYQASQFAYSLAG